MLLNYLNLDFIIGQTRRHAENCRINLKIHFVMKYTVALTSAYDVIVTGLIFITDFKEIISIQTLIQFLSHVAKKYEKEMEIKFAVSEGSV